MKKVLIFTLEKGMKIIWIILLVLIIWFTIKPRKEHLTGQANGRGLRPRPY